MLWLTAPAHAGDGVLAGLRWGMSVDAAAAALGERAQRLDPPIDYGVGKARLFLKGTKAGDAAMTAFYQFDGAAMTLDPSKDFLDPRLPSYEYETFKRRAFPRRIVLRYFPTAEKELAGPAPCA
ncbi:MAG: hypothetical protein L6R19_01665 [Alphaproteobacteria bacterium]|nr:hypothetical protein [Alphaproteobacteria bacterium]